MFTFEKASRSARSEIYIERCTVVNKGPMGINFVVHLMRESKQHRRKEAKKRTARRAGEM